MKALNIWKLTYCNINHKGNVILNGKPHSYIFWRFFWLKVSMR